MSSNSSIEWTEATWNPVTGCTRVSAGCDNCYAVKQSYRLERMGQVEKYGGLTVLNKKKQRHFNGVVRCHEDALEIPLKRRKPTLYFVNSMSDLFHPDVPIKFIKRIWKTMWAADRHTYQILTKRPERMAEVLSDEWFWPSFNRKDHIWLGTSCENQDAADERIPHLLKCLAAVRFLSLEPLLGPIVLPIRRISQIQRDEKVGYVRASRIAEAESIHWVIVGGESGPNARPCNIEWIRSIIEQCKVADVPVFVKQLGKYPQDEHGDMGGQWIGGGIKDQGGIVRHPKGGVMSEWPEDLRIREMPQLERSKA